MERSTCYSRTNNEDLKAGLFMHVLYKISLGVYRCICATCSGFSQTISVFFIHSSPPTTKPEMGNPSKCKPFYSKTDLKLSGPPSNRAPVTGLEPVTKGSSQISGGFAIPCATDTPN
ncbi:hypothetical protein PoB_002423900 [Plakobranchus ocellatus]|uniref:Uncharacterized protein n=1 Tax=Plakobranchus ocellatus TaxID=259542 RepID=A0AAV3ZV10_9GAST|nr:hypothetical protein PoB_002423900 [Plakobranchus ocellatus]